jgi:hypothetical protein
MFDNGTLIIVDEFHKASLHVVFVPTFQKRCGPYGYYMECPHGPQNYKKWKVYFISCCSTSFSTS